VLGAVITLCGAPRNGLPFSRNVIRAGRYRRAPPSVKSDAEMVPKTRHRRHIGPPRKPTSPILAPHAIWNADFTGPFTTGDGLYCDPLTVADGYSRFLLGCQALSSTRVPEAKPVFTRLFKAFGLPKRSRTDHGVPCATNTLARLSQLSSNTLGCCSL
jgi:putative transposase